MHRLNRYAILYTKIPLFKTAWEVTSAMNTQLIPGAFFGFFWITPRCTDYSKVLRCTYFFCDVMGRRFCEGVSVTIGTVHMCIQCLLALGLPPQLKIKSRADIIYPICDPNLLTLHMQSAKKSSMCLHLPQIETKHCCIMQADKEVTFINITEVVCCYTYWGLYYTVVSIYIWEEADLHDTG